MAAHPIFTEKEGRFLKALLANEVDFMIVGLSAALLQGAPAVTQGIDLWIRDTASAGFRRALKQVGAVYVPPIGLNPPMLAGDAVKLFDLVGHMSGLDSFEQEFAAALRIEIRGAQIPVLPLDRIIASKEAADREKDRLVLPVLRDAAIARSVEQSRKKR